MFRKCNNFLTVVVHSLKKINITIDLMRSFLPCIGAGGGGRTGGTVQVGGPFAAIEGLEKSSSDGLVNELLIWLHRALILSPSSVNPISISGNSKKGKHRGRQRGEVKKKKVK